jgi:hypothetical protein
MDSSRFDELTKALATATSRRQALKTIAATTLGSILGLGGIGTALASNMTCAQWCQAVFGENTPADEQCAGDAAHHTGLCYSCGPASPGGGVAPSSICCPRTSSGYCTSYSSATCCGSSATCLGGSCCANANVCGTVCLSAPCNSSQCETCDSSSGTCVGCPSGHTCQNGTCCTNTYGTCSGNGDCCSGTCCQGTCCGSGQVCLSNGSCATPNCSVFNCLSFCVCASDTSGAEYCTTGGYSGDCTTDKDCPRGSFCGENDFGISSCLTLC